MGKEGLEVRTAASEEQFPDQQPLTHTFKSPST